MRHALVIHGVPHALQTDAWWLETSPGDQPSGGGQGQTGQARPTGRFPDLRLLALILMADLLLWDVTPGLSLALFALAIFAVTAAPHLAKRQTLAPAFLLVAGVLPVVELVQPLSIAFLVAALALALVWARDPWLDPGERLHTALALLLRLPKSWVQTLLRSPRLLIRGRALTLDHRPHVLRQMLRNWAFPLGGTLVLAALLAEANPVLARLLTPQVDMQQTVLRGLFWIGIALMLAPLLTEDLPDLSGHTPARLRLPNLGVNAGSVPRALLVFNLMLGAQMITDISILIGGADLPAGLTLAEYAHRGAYPLLATALLAGAFALAARPFLDEHRLIRPLLMLWLAQNVVLCAAAARRLDLYVVSYGLTYLRLYAFIWMALVATGLGMTAWQILAQRSNTWLLARGTALAVATLYACSFVNFAHIIATQNLKREKVDMAYICALGPMAAPAIEAAQMQPLLSRSYCAALQPHPVRHWQEWGFRTWRTNRYLAKAITPGRPHEDPHRR